MLDFLFYLFAALTVGAGLLMVLSRNAVSGAMLMIVSLLGSAVLFILLEATFLGILQILVYAGAVMVLFLFIVMLLNVEQAAKKRPDLLTIISSTVAFLLVAGGLLWVVFDSPALAVSSWGSVPVQPSTEDPMAFATAPRAYGYGLFTKYLLPLQVTGFLLLIAMIGVIVLSKRLTASGEEAETAPAARS